MGELECFLGQVAQFVYEWDPAFLIEIGCASPEVKELEMASSPFLEPTASESSSSSSSEESPQTAEFAEVSTKCKLCFVQMT